MERDINYRTLTLMEFREKYDKLKHKSIANTMTEYKTFEDFSKHYRIVETKEYITMLVIGYVEVDLVATARSKNGGEVMKVTCPLRQKYKEQFIAEKIAENEAYVGAKKSHNFNNFKY